MNWIPLEDKVIVEPDEAPDRVGAILLPDQARQTPQTGKVLAVGEGKRDDSGKLLPMPLRAGDKVMFSKWGGTDYEIEKGRTIKVLSVSDILARQN